MTYFVDLLLKAGTPGDHGQRFLIELDLSHAINLDQLIKFYKLLLGNRLQQILAEHGESMVQFMLRISL